MIFAFYCESFHVDDSSGAGYGDDSLSSLSVSPELVVGSGAAVVTRNRRGLQCGELTLTVKFFVRGVTLNDHDFRSFSPQRWLGEEESCIYQQESCVYQCISLKWFITYIVCDL